MKVYPRECGATRDVDEVEGESHDRVYPRECGATVFAPGEFPNNIE